MLYTSCMNFQDFFAGLLYYQSKGVSLKAQLNSSYRSVLKLSYLLQEIISEGLSNGTLLCVSIMYTVKNSFADQTKPQKFNNTKIFHANYFLM